MICIQITTSNDVFNIINTNHISEVQSTLVIGNAIASSNVRAIKAMAKDIELGWITQPILGNMSICLLIFKAIFIIAISDFEQI